MTNFREPENKEVEKQNRTNLPFSSQIPFKVICPDSLNSPLKIKKGKSLSQIIANQEQVLPDRGEGEKKEVWVLELAAPGSNLITQAP